MATPPAPETRLLRAGIGLRAPHVREVMATRPPIGWIEVHAENYMGGGAAVRTLEALRGDYPIALHGVGLSLGRADALDERHLARLHRLVERLVPELVSEHLSWSEFGGGYLNHLLPLPYTEEALAVVGRHVDQLQERLGRQVLVENPSSYLRFRHSPIAEPEFLRELVRRTGCGLLCDVNNIYVSGHNLGFDSTAYLDALPGDAVGEIHIAGHAVNDADGRSVLIDDHGSPPIEAVWALYQRALARFGSVPTLVEWDTNLPPLAILLAEAAQADRVLATAAAEGTPEGMRMLALGELQAAFRRAVQGEPEAALLAEIVEDGLTASARLDIYRHHVLATLTDVLVSAYPVVCRLVDARFFAYAADQYIRAHLPKSPCLFEYGASLAEFLGEFPPCRDLAYLPDVARLEWALHAARHADEATALDPSRLAAVPPDQIPWLVLRLDPSVAYVASPWPVDDIWRANQPERHGDDPVDLGAGGAHLEIRRLADDIVFRSLDRSTFAFRRALAHGQPLAEAADQALALRADFPLAEAVRDLLGNGIAVDLALISPPKEV